MPEQLYSPGETATEVTLTTPVASAGLLYELPYTEVENINGWVTAKLLVTERTWLERLILLLGPGTKVLSPHEWSDAGAVAAKRVLQKYS